MTSKRIGALAAIVLLGAADSLWADGRAPAYRLTLVAADNPAAVYFSAWEDGPVISDHSPRDRQPLTYRRDFRWSDGCIWQAVERLTPDGDRYLYRYNEHLVDCPSGRKANGTPSPRRGQVLIEPLPPSPPQELTPLTSVATSNALADE